MPFPILGRPRPQFQDSSGSPYASGTLEVLEPADDTNKSTYPTYDDAVALTNANDNPITLNGRGEPPTGLWGLDNQDYKIVLKDSFGATVSTDDDIFLPARGQFYDISSSEVVAGITPSDYSYEYGNVFRYGAVGDGVTNDSSAVQSALDSGELHILFPSGYTFLVTTELTSTIADRSIEGFGATITTDASIADEDYILLSSGARTTIVGLTFTGVVSTTDCGAVFVSGAGSEVSSCRFNDFDNGGGIIVNSAATGTLITRNQLNNCSPIQLGGTQYGSIHCNANECIISNNRITDNDLTGISSAGSDYLVISDNYIKGKTTGTTSGGVLLDGNNVGCTITGNVINGCKVEGIQINGSLTLYTTPSREHVISGNVILDAEYSAISINASDTGGTVNVSITGNTLKYDNASARAIQLSRAQQVNISGNYIYGYDDGIEVSNACPDVNITGNTFENQDATGIQVFGRYWLVSGNRIIGDGAAGSTTGITFNGSTTAGDQLIVGNQIKDCLVGVNGTFSGSQRTYINSNHFINNGTDLNYTGDNTNSSSNNVFDGDAIAGTFTLVAGAASVANTSLQAGDRIVLSKVSNGGTAGAVYVNARSDGTSFTVASTSGTDTSTYSYEFIR